MSSPSVHEHISPHSVNSLSASVGYGTGTGTAGVTPSGSDGGAYGGGPSGGGGGGPGYGGGGRGMLGRQGQGTTMPSQRQTSSSYISPQSAVDALMKETGNTGYVSHVSPTYHQTQMQGQQPQQQSQQGFNQLYPDFNATSEFVEQILDLGTSPAPGPSGSGGGGGGGGGVSALGTYRAQPAVSGSSSNPAGSSSNKAPGEGWNGSFDAGFSTGMPAGFSGSSPAGEAPQQNRSQSTDNAGFSRPSHLGSSSSYTGSANPGPTAITPKQSHMRVTPGQSGDNSPALSDNEDEDPLGPTSIMAPLSSMAGLAEAAVAIARMESRGKTPLRESTDAASMAGRTATGIAASGPRPAGEDENDRATKRRKLGDGSSSAKVSFATPAVPEYALLGKGDKVKIGNSPVVDLPTTTEVVRTARGKKVRRHVHAFPDVVALGLVQEQEAKQLFDLFFEGCHAFIPIFDLERDTWDGLRDRSPFLISSIVAIGARVRDGGGPVSETQRLALEHSRKIAISTLFTPVCRIEAVQAMILIAAFNDTGWVPANYAGLLAIDMGLNKCFSKLLQTGVGSKKSSDALEDERDLVVGSRCWLCLYMIEHQMAFGTGRPALLREDECVTKCRLLLQHPLSIPSDVRLVSTVELMALRAPLHVLLTNSPDEPVDQATVIRLQQANADFDRWQTYWDRVLADKFGIDTGDFYRESLATQREYSSLFINSQLLRGVREAADVKRMPDDKRELAMKAMKNAQNCLDIALRGKNYRNALKFGELGFSS